MKFRTQYTWSKIPGEINSMEIVTIPNQAMTVQEIMQRFASGRPIPKSVNMMYTGDDYTPDVRKMDISEYEDLKEATRINIEQLHKQIKDKANKKANDEQQARNEAQASNEANAT